MSERKASQSVLVSPGTRLPYSKGLMARTLSATGLPPERAYELARAIEAELAARAEGVVTVRHVYDVAAQVLAEQEGEEAVRQLRRYQALESLDVPLLILVGGTTGTGKSTLVTEVAHRLGITRVTSTDLIRQTMRAFFSPDFMPSIHHSSFEARATVDADVPDPLIYGFLEQTRNVLVGVKAVLDRARVENHSLALEGVHVVPGLVAPALEGAVVVQCLVVVEDEEEHARHFYSRDADSDGMRPNEKYLAALPDIRRVQDYLVERAREAGTPIVASEDQEAAVDAVIKLVLDAVDRAGAVRA